MTGLPRVRALIGKAHLSRHARERVARAVTAPTVHRCYTATRAGYRQNSANVSRRSRTRAALRPGCVVVSAHGSATAVDTACVGDRLTGTATADHDVCRGGTMTHSIDAPFPPPPSTGTGATSATSGTTATTTTTTTSTGSPSTSDVAKDEARNVGQTAAQAGSQVASTAADQAKEVAYETQRQAQDLLHQGRQQLRQQTVAQQQKAATGLSSLAQELRGLADGSSQGAPGPARDLLQQASGYVDRFADRLQNREPADLLEDVRAFARRRPGAFLLGAAVAGRSEERRVGKECRSRWSPYH